MEEEEKGSDEERVKKEFETKQRKIRINKYQSLPFGSTNHS